MFVRWRCKERRWRRQTWGERRDYANRRKCNLQLTKLWVWLKCKPWDKNTTGWRRSSSSSRHREGGIQFKFCLESNEIIQLPRSETIATVSHIKVTFLPISFTLWLSFWQSGREQGKVKLEGLWRLRHEWVLCDAECISVLVYCSWLLLC